MANVYPNLFSAFVQEAIPKKNNILSQGGTRVEVNAQVSQSGQYFSIPQQDNLYGLLGNSTAITASSTQVTPTELSSFEEKGLVAHIGAGIKDADLTKFLSGKDGVRLVYSQIAPYMMIEAQRYLASTITGVFDTALATSHTYDATTLGDGTLTYDAIAVGTQEKLGEAFEDLDAIIMHSKMYSDLRRKGLTDYVDAASFGENVLYRGQIPTFDGKRIVVNDTICEATDNVYPVFVIGGQPFYIGYQSQLRIETDRQADYGGGTDRAFFYMDFVPHVFGVSFSGSVTNPTTTTYETGGNWTKVGENKNIKIVKINVNAMA